MIPVDSPFFVLKTTPYGGRSLFAAAPVPPGTLIHTSCAPCAHVIYKDYRKVVCAWCFIYSDVGSFKIASSEAHKSGVTERFCSVACRDLWVVDGSRCNGIRDKLHNAVEAGVRRMNRAKHKSAVLAPPRPPQELPGDAFAAAQDALDAAWIAGAAHASADIAQLNEMELEIMRFVCAGLVQMYLLRHESPAAMPADSTENPSYGSQSILNLQENELPHTRQRPYILDSHIRIYNFLRSATALALGRRDSAAIFGSAEAAGGQRAGGWVRAVLSRDAGNAFGIRQALVGADMEHHADRHEESEMLGWGLWTDASFFNHSVCQLGLNACAEWHWC